MSTPMTNEPVFHPAAVSMDPPPEAAPAQASTETVSDAQGQAQDADQPAPEPVAEEAPAPASIIEDVEVSDGVAFNFREDAGHHYLEHPIVPYVGNEHELEKIGDGDLFFAGYLHDPAKSVDHYDYQNYKEALISGKVSRKGLPPKYWRDHAMKRPPVMRKVSRVVVFVE